MILTVLHILINSHYHVRMDLNLLTTICDFTWKHSSRHINMTLVFIFHNMMRNAASLWNRLKIDHIHAGVLFQGCITAETTAWPLDQGHQDVSLFSSQVQCSLSFLVYQSYKILVNVPEQLSPRNVQLDTEKPNPLASIVLAADLCSNPKPPSARMHGLHLCGVRSGWPNFWQPKMWFILLTQGDCDLLLEGP